MLRRQGLVRHGTSPIDEPAIWLCTKLLVTVTCPVDGVVWDVWDQHDFVEAVRGRSARVTYSSGRWLSTKTREAERIDEADVDRS